MSPLLRQRNFWTWWRADVESCRTACSFYGTYGTPTIAAAGSFLHLIMEGAPRADEVPARALDELPLVTLRRNAST
jgi:hypothetical protein